MARFVEIDGCPVPVAKADVVRECKRRSGGVLQSCYRGDDPEGVAILNRNGKHSQRQIVNATAAERAAWGVLGTPNPVGRSTHEGYSDGVAYPGPVGRPLEDWQIGEDWRDEDIERVMRAYTEMGLAPIHPYAAGVEYHHVNPTKPPRLFRPLKRGSIGPRVGLLTHRIRIIEQHHPRAERPKKLCPYTGRYGDAVWAHVKALQYNLGLKPDGIVGPVTWRNIEAAARKAKKAARR